MRVYLDTSVISHIGTTGTSTAVRRLLDAAGWHVQASADNLFEIYAISDAASRSRELDALVAVAHTFEAWPASYLEARQVLAAIKRHRPAWIRRFKFSRRSRGLVAAHRQRWVDARAGRLPDPKAYAEYRRVFESGSSQSRAFMKQLRKAKLDEGRAIVMKQYGDRLATLDLALDTPASFWRAECWLAYDAALLHRNPANRDTADWLLPSINVTKIGPGDLFLFWLRDATEEEMPRARWAGTVTFFQLESRITHGNPHDMLHAAHALDADVFLTADTAFHSALRKAARTVPYPVAALPEWDRKNPHPDEVLRGIIGERSKDTG